MTDPKLNAEHSTVAIKRILITLDSSAEGLAALQRAAALAAHVEAELTGVFIEDTDLLRLAGLPFAREVTYASTDARRLDHSGMEKQLRARGRQLEQILATTARRVHARWQFRVARGRTVPTALDLAHDTDLIILAKTRRACFEPPARPGGTAPPRPVLVLYDQADANRALAGAAQLVERDTGRLCVVLPEHDATALRNRAHQWLQSHGMDEDFHILHAPMIPDVVNAAQQQKALMVVLYAGGLLATREHLALLVEELSCPVALVP